MISYYSRLFFFLFLPVTLYGQVDAYRAQPSINLSWHDNSRWSFNTTIEQRNDVTDGVKGLHIQAAQFASYEIGFYTQLGAGIMYRELFDSTRPEELRFTEQFVHARKYNTLKLAHRVRWDQRIRGDILTHRWRYRFSGSIPLNGQSTDASEFYLTASLESLFIAQKNKKPAMDQRLAVGIGTKISNDIKIQLVTEYRWEDYTQNTDRLLFFNLGLYYSL